jgi:putative hemolysin
MAPEASVTTRLFLEIAMIGALILANAVFAMSEIAIVTARRARLERAARRGRRGATAAIRLADNPDRFLPTIQTGITLVGVLAGAFGGATIATEIDHALEAIPGMAPYSEAVGVGVVVIAITYLSLVIGELVPKRLALAAPEKIAIRVAPFLQSLSRVASPVVRFLGWSTRVILAVLPFKQAAEPAATDEEVRLLLHQWSRSGTIAPEERRILERAFLLGDRSIRSVMTPRIEVEWIDLTQPLETARERAAASVHSRFPVARERIDRIEGILSGKDLWSSNARSFEEVLPRLREPLFIPETSSPLHVLEMFRSTRNHTAVVVDEYGGFEGLVTPADILEAIVGELPEPEDRYEPQVFRRQDGSLSVDAVVDVEEVKIHLGESWLDGQKEEGFQTIAGYVIERLGRNPKLGDVVDAGSYRFEIIDMDRRRVDRILVSKAPEPPA